MMACLLGIDQANLPLLSLRCAIIKLSLHDGLLARHRPSKLASALATLRHCHPKYEIFSPEMGGEKKESADSIGNRHLELRLLLLSEY